MKDIIQYLMIMMLITFQLSVTTNNIKNVEEKIDVLGELYDGRCE